MQTLNESQLWLLVIGAAMIDPAYRKRATAVLTSDDAPDGLTRALWLGMAAGNKQDVSEMLGVECNGQPVISAALQRAQADALQRFCETHCRQAEFSKGLEPSQMLDVLDVAASKIRAKLAAIEKAKESK